MNQFASSSSSAARRRAPPTDEEKAAARAKRAAALAAQIAREKNKRRATVDLGGDKAAKARASAEAAQRARSQEAAEAAFAARFSGGASRAQSAGGAPAAKLLLIPTNIRDAPSSSEDDSSSDDNAAPPTKREASPPLVLDSMLESEPEEEGELPHTKEAPYLAPINPRKRRSAPRSALTPEEAIDAYYYQAKASELFLEEDDDHDDLHPGALPSASGASLTPKRPTHFASAALSPEERAAGHTVALFMDGAEFARLGERVRRGLVDTRPPPEWTKVIAPMRLDPDTGEVAAETLYRYTTTRADEDARRAQIAHEDAEDAEEAQRKATKAGKENPAFYLDSRPISILIRGQELSRRAARAAKGLTDTRPDASRLTLVRPERLDPETGALLEDALYRYTSTKGEEDRRKDLVPQEVEENRRFDGKAMREARAQKRLEVLASIDRSVQRGDGVPTSFPRTFVWYDVDGRQQTTREDFAAWVAAKRARDTAPKHAQALADEAHEARLQAQKASLRAQRDAEARARGKAPIDWEAEDARKKAAADPKYTVYRLTPSVTLEEQKFLQEQGLWAVDADALRHAQPMGGEVTWREAVKELALPEQRLDPNRPPPALAEGGMLTFRERLRSKAGQRNNPNPRGTLRVVAPPEFGHDPKRLVALRAAEEAQEAEARGDLGDGLGWSVGRTAFAGTSADEIYTRTYMAEIQRERAQRQETERRQAAQL